MGEFMTSETREVAVKIWDLPTRIFHWSLLLAIVACWQTAGGDGDMDRHFLCGYVVLALLLFRLVWGVIGSTTARFANFIAVPRAVLAYLKNMRAHNTPHPGHNPAGGWMVLLLLIALLVISITGLFANDDIMSEGPLAHYVGESLSDLATSWHERAFYTLLALVGLHLGAILFYLLVKKENLVRPMLSGDKYFSREEMPALHMRNMWWALPVLCSAALLVWWLARLGVTAEF